MNTITTTFRTTKEKVEQLDLLASSMNRSKNWILNEALNNYLSYNEWFLKEVNKGIEEADNNNFASQEEVNALFKQYGTK